ncbi:MAG: hypothetical protein V9G10_07475 [Candidatus Nanopelagicales bacterium]
MPRAPWPCCRWPRPSSTGRTCRCRWIPIWSTGIVAAALPQLAADLPVLFLPTQAVGFSPEHARFAGTLTLKS